MVVKPKIQNRNVLTTVKEYKFSCEFQLVEFQLTGDAITDENRPFYALWDSMSAQSDHRDPTVRLVGSPFMVHRTVGEVEDEPSTVGIVRVEGGPVAPEAT